MTQAVTSRRCDRPHRGTAPSGRSRPPPEQEASLLRLAAASAPLAPGIEATRSPLASKEKQLQATRSPVRRVAAEAAKAASPEPALDLHVRAPDNQRQPG